MRFEYLDTCSAVLANNSGSQITVLMLVPRTMQQEATHATQTRQWQALLQAISSRRQLIAVFELCPGLQRITQLYQSTQRVQVAAGIDVNIEYVQSEEHPEE